MGSANYNIYGKHYSRFRIPDILIKKVIQSTLVKAESIINIGAGTGSYEPADKYVVAVEPSETMIALRQSDNICIRGCAEHLPFSSESFDVALGILTIHHWSDWVAGLHEAIRVARSVRTPLKICIKLDLVLHCMT